MRVLITGATGAIGIPLVTHLLARGDSVTALVRSHKNRPLGQLRRRFGQGDLSFVIGDSTLPLGGVSDRDLDALRGSFDAIVHSAGETQYHEHLRAETFRVNLGGAQNVMDLSADLQIPRFVFISTAYVGGNAPYLGEDERGISENAHNPYESSKIAAERLVLKYPGEVITLRLSTVIGDAATGYIAGVGGYAGFVKGFHSFRPRIIRYPKNPFFVGVNPASTLNLITGDWIVKHIRMATDSSLTGTLHLTHPTPVKMGWLFDQTFKGEWLTLPVSYDAEEARKTSLYTSDATWKSTQDAISGIVQYFGPYVTRDTVFGHERVKQIPGYAPPPIIDETVIGAQMAFMMNHLFVPAKRALAVAAE